MNTFSWQPASAWHRPKNNVSIGLNGNILPSLDRENDNTLFGFFEGIIPQPDRVVYLPFTRYEQGVLFLHNTPLNPDSVLFLEQYLARANIRLQLVRFTDQDATDFRDTRDAYIAALDATKFTADVMYINCTLMWKNHLRRLGVTV